MGTVYALLTGINAYPVDRCTPLEGCLNDVEAAEELLLRRADGRLELRRLLNGDATVTAVEAAVRGHLGQAGPGDTALFWFSGHGSEMSATERAPRPEPRPGPASPSTKSPHTEDPDVREAAGATREHRRALLG